jgi:hypothetical protein
MASMSGRVLLGLPVALVPQSPVIVCKQRSYQVTEVAVTAWLFYVMGCLAQVSQSCPLSVPTCPAMNKHQMTVPLPTARGSEHHLCHLMRSGGSATVRPALPLPTASGSDPHLVMDRTGSAALGPALPLPERRPETAEVQH